MNDNYQRKILVLTVLTIIFTIMGSTLAYWNWMTTEEQRTSITFTAGNPEDSCSVDGGGNITSTEKYIMPTSCTDPDRAIQRVITTSTTTKISSKEIYMDLWLDVVNIGQGLTNSKNFKYALTKQANDCSNNVLATGSFKGVTSGGIVNLFNNQTFTGTTNNTYYLYIWLDAEETSTDTMNQSFKLRLNGSCVDAYPSPEAPVLDEGMIPVTISDSGTVTTVSEDDTNWYNYEEKKWANVVLVNETGTTSRTNYKNNPGTTVNKDDILAYYVWIPRYRYSIPSATSCDQITNPNYEKHSSCYEYNATTEQKENLSIFLQLMLGEEYPLEFAEKGIENGLKKGVITVYVGEIEIPYSPFSLFLEQYNSYNETPIELELEFNSENEWIEQSVDITFEKATDAMTTTGNEITHPAFWWDNDSNSSVDSGETVAGIWVGKFEPSTDGSNVTILPDKAPLVEQNVNTQFTTSRTLSSSGNIYGLSSSSTNAHMLKNSEWGAVAYLSHSKYGIDSEIRINNYYNNEYKTGCGASTVDGAASETCEITYGTPSNETNTYPQSTTGNISGVFDINGGTFEYVMGNFDNTIGSSGFTTLPEKKYYDLYTSEIFKGDYTINIDYCTTETCGGHALDETYGWHKDFASFVGSGGPWFARGGFAEYGSFLGAFAADLDVGGSHSYYSWRSALVVGFGA